MYISIQLTKFVNADSRIRTRESGDNFSHLIYQFNMKYSPFSEIASCTFVRTNPFWI